MQSGPQLGGNCIHGSLSFRKRNRTENNLLETRCLQVKTLTLADLPLAMGKGQGFPVVANLSLTSCGSERVC